MEGEEGGVCAQHAEDPVEAGDVGAEACGAGPVYVFDDAVGGAVLRMGFPEPARQDSVFSDSVQHAVRADDGGVHRARKDQHPGEHDERVERQPERGWPGEKGRLYTDPQSICAYPDGNVHQSYIALFECEAVGGELCESDETGHFHWMSREEMDRYALLPDSVLCCTDAWAAQESAFIR